jgi:Ca-activated chloride channel homolog
VTFLYPDYLWGFLLLPVLGIVLLLVAIRNRSTLAALIGGRARDDVVYILSVKSFVVTVLLSIALSSLVVALAGPQWGEVSVEDERRGLELVFLVDVSNSMLVSDVSPSRLGRSREVARAVVSRLPGLHHSVMVFKGSASVLVPMTDEPTAFELAMTYLSPALVTTPGTNIDEALTSAARAFPDGTPRRRAILMFSDGGHDNTVNTRVLESVRDTGIPVYTILTGTAAGGTVPTTDGDVLRNDLGEPIVTGATEDLMQRIASTTGGNYYRLSDANLVQRLVGDLEQFGGFRSAMLFRQVSVDRYHLFVLSAILLLTIMILVQNVRWRGIL